MPSSSILQEDYHAQSRQGTKEDEDPSLDVAAAVC